MIEQTESTTFENTLAFAQQMDQADLLADFRKEFYFPQHQGQDQIYFTGNSLGLQPKSARTYLEGQMKRWEELAVEGHFAGDNPWLNYHRQLREPLSRIVGALPEEITVMNTLTVNVHLLMVSFYQPQAKRNKILMEAHAFPSDQYAVASQAHFHGLAPQETVLEFQAREGEYLLRTEDMVQKIKDVGDELALVMLGGVNYASGQFFDLAAISQAAHEVGAYVGFDLAHAVGNVPLHLHAWDVDFACWCSYKYLNSGPGGISGAYIHEKHHDNPNMPRFNGWWGYKESTRFLMEKDFVPEPDADAWQLSNAPILLLATHHASLELFDRAGMHNLRLKSLQLTAYLEYLIHQVNEEVSASLGILTPQNPEQRGCQLSIIVEPNGKAVFDGLIASGVMVDWREPNIIRAAPVPIYNSFQDVFHFADRLKTCLGG